MRYQETLRSGDANAQQSETRDDAVMGVALRCSPASPLSSARDTNGNSCRCTETLDCKQGSDNNNNNNKKKHLPSSFSHYF